MHEDRYAGFPSGFFDRGDEMPDAAFYRPPRLVTHIDEGAIAAVGRLYRELGVDGCVLDLMASWVSHFEDPPRELTVLGMNATELEHNPMATRRVVHDLNADPVLPFGDAEFDDAVCCVSVDYLVRPIEVFVEVARVVRPGGRFVCTFSNRCFPTKAIRGWLAGSDEDHCALVAEYFRRADAWDEPHIAGSDWSTPLLPPGSAPRPGPRADLTSRGDPLYAVWARRR